MPSYSVQLRQLESIQLAVIRRTAKPSELTRLVPECCGLVWNAIRAQQAKAGRHVAIYWDSTMRVDVGAELFSPFEEQGDVVLSATPAGPAASTTH